MRWTARKLTPTALATAPSGPMRGGAWRLRTGQCQHFGNHLRWQWRPAGFARLVAEQPIDALLGIALLPAPYRRPANAAAPGDIKDWQPVCGMKNDARPLNMLLRAVAIVDDRRQLRSVFSGENETDGVCHATSMDRFAKNVNLLSASVH
jgi:hypothetical protein